MSDTYGIAGARAQLGTLVRRAAISRERIALTDHGRVAALRINPDELADLEDSLAVAQNAIPYEDVVREVAGEARHSAA